MIYNERPQFYQENDNRYAYAPPRILGLKTGSVFTVGSKDSVFPYLDIHPIQQNVDFSRIITLPSGIYKIVGRQTLTVSYIDAESKSKKTTLSTVLVIQNSDGSAKYAFALR